MENSSEAIAARSRLSLLLKGLAGLVGYGIVHITGLDEQDRTDTARHGRAAAAADALAC